jgi:hypothetical protein
MVFTLVQPQKSQTPEAIKADPLISMRELVVYCPRCRTLETLWFNNGRLMEARKFTQLNSHVFHDCGSQQPCRLYRSGL